MARLWASVVTVVGTALQVLAQAPPTPVGQPLTPVGQQPPGQLVPFKPAQNPGQPTGRIPTPGAENPVDIADFDPALVAHLQAWDKVMQGATNFYAKFSLQNKVQKPFPKTTQYTGSMICLKPNLARMRMELKPAAGQQPGANDFEAYICSGKAVFHYEGPSQTVTVYPIQNGVGENLLLELMSGQLRANDILRRFEAKILKQDQHYIYLELVPKLSRDKSEFNTMTLVLFQPTLPGVGYLPRTVLVRKDNGNKEEVWDFPEPATNVQGIKPTDFEYVAPAKGWKVQQMQTPPAARPMNPMGGFTPVTRPSGK